jgi:agmatine deiminase
MYVKIVQALRLSKGLKTRIIIHNQQEQHRVQKILFNCPNVEFFIIETDDIWIRDNGPTFVRDKEGI